LSDFYDKLLQQVAKNIIFKKFSFFPTFILVNNRMDDHHVGLHHKIEKKEKQILKKQGVCVTVALPFTLKYIFFKRQKKNYGTSNNSPCKNIIFKKKKFKSFERNQKSFKILLL
jgi:hypothetical protein